MKKYILSVFFIFAALAANAQSGSVGTDVSDSTGLQVSIPAFADFRAVSGDTMYMISGGGMPQGELIHISWPSVEDIKVRQCYQTSVEVLAGGSNHIDLKNFMHGYTAWEVTAAVDSAFTLLSEPEFKGKLPFPAVSQSKLRAAAKLVVDDPKLVNKITTPCTAPCSVWYSGIIIEISGTDRVTKKPRKMFVVVELPLTC